MITVCCSACCFVSTGTAGTAADAPGSALFSEVGRCPGCTMDANARVLLARAQTQTLLPPLVTIDRFENGGLPRLQFTVPTNHLFITNFTKTLREECSGDVRGRAWVRFGLSQAVKKTASTSDNLVWLTSACRFHPASRRTQRANRCVFVKIFKLLYLCTEN